MIIKEFFDNYTNTLHSQIRNVSSDDLQLVYDILIKCINDNNTLFVCGNGGSAAIAEHFTCDYSKGIATNTSKIPKVHSLVSNVSLMTAIANDISYEDVFASQLLLSGNNSDVLLAVSSSGNSPNIVKAIKAANLIGMKTISFTGFDGGTAKKTANVNIHIPLNNYGIVEDCHHILMHTIIQYIRTVHTSVDLDKVKL
jgi:D-sedoheptulose 7-phosphate isomerase